MTKTLKNSLFVSISVLFLVIGLFLTAHAAITPVLSVINANNGYIQLTVNADANTSVQLYYYNSSTPTYNTYGSYGNNNNARNVGNIGYTNMNGYFSAQVSYDQYNIPASASVYAVVDGVASQVVSWPAFTNYSSQTYSSYSNSYNNSYSNYPTPTYSPLPNPTYQPYSNYPVYPPVTLGQSNLNLTTGQSQTVSIYGTGTYFIYSNTNTSAVSASVSGSILSIYASNPGNTSITICENVGSSCVIMAVNVTAPIPVYYPQTYYPQNPQTYYSQTYPQYVSYTPPITYYQPQYRATYSPRTWWGIRY